MFINNSVVQKDLDEIINFKYLEKCRNKLKNKTILISGASGFIGRQLVLIFLYFNDIYDLNIKIIALARDKTKTECIFNNLLKKNKLELYLQDIKNSIKISDKIDYIIHCANSTSSKFFIENPVENIKTIIFGTDNILKFAKEQKIESIVYLSSLEVYGLIDVPSIKENDYGYIDPLNVRSSYPEGKRLAETLCSSYYSEYDVPVKIIRLSQIFGAAANYDDGRFFYQFARSIIKKEDIVLHTSGNSIFSSCYISDAIGGIILVLLKGISGECYNLANPNNIFSIKQVAEAFVKKYPNSKIVFEFKNSSYYPPKDINLKINTEKIESLGWSASIGLEESIDRVVFSFLENSDKIV